MTVPFILNQTANWRSTLFTCQTNKGSFRYQFIMMILLLVQSSDFNWKLFSRCKSCRTVFLIGLIRDFSSIFYPIFTSNFIFEFQIKSQQLHIFISKGGNVRVIDGITSSRHIITHCIIHYTMIAVIWFLSCNHVLWADSALDHHRIISSTPTPTILHIGHSQYYVIPYDLRSSRSLYSEMGPLVYLITPAVFSSHCTDDCAPVLFGSLCNDDSPFALLDSCSTVTILLGFTLRRRVYTWSANSHCPHLLYFIHAAALVLLDLALQQRFCTRSTWFSRRRNMSMRPHMSIRHRMPVWYLMSMWSPMLMRCLIITALVVLTVVVHLLLSMLLDRKGK